MRAEHISEVGRAGSHCPSPGSIHLDKQGADNKFMPICHCAESHVPGLPSATPVMPDKNKNRYMSLMFFSCNFILEGYTLILPLILYWNIKWQTLSYCCSLWRSCFLMEPSRNMMIDQLCVLERALCWNRQQWLSNSYIQCLELFMDVGKHQNERKNYGKRVAW